MVWIILGAVIVLFVLWLLLSKIYVYISYQYQHKIHTINLRVKLRKIPIYSKEWQVQLAGEEDFWEVIEDIKIKEEIDSLRNDFGSMMEKIKHIRFLVRSTLKQIDIQNFDWKTWMGTGDASTTGMMSGVLWMLKGSLIGVLHEMSTMVGKPQVLIQPAFQQKVFQSQLTCIVSVRLGKAIHMLFKVMLKAPTKKEAYI